MMFNLPLGFRVYSNCKGFVSGGPGGFAGFWFFFAFARFLGGVQNWALNPKP